MKGEHVTRHTPGIWNGMWTDTMIETTFMRYGKGPNGIIGITLKPNTIETWTMSLHIWSVLAKDISDMTSDDEHQHLHKEETKARMTADATDRSKIRHKLQESIDTLDSSTHSDGNIVHIVSGKRANDPSVNIHEAVAVGTEMVKLYESTWPGGFYDTLPKKVRTTAITKKHIQVGSAKVYDTNLIYSRIIGLQASGREMNLKEVLKYESSPIPTSMFTTKGEMRLATSK